MEIMVNYETGETVTLKDLIPIWWGNSALRNPTQKKQIVKIKN